MTGKFAVAIAVLTASAATASAQTTALKWEAEVHGGLLSAGHSSSGTPIAGFPATTSFTTRDGMTSRAVSSWFFGDGAVLLNAVNSIHSTPALVSPLDGTLRSSAAGSDAAGSFGLRAARDVASHVSIEFGFDYARTPLALTREAKDAIEAARTSFIDAWNDFLDSRLNPATRHVTAIADSTAGSGGQLFITGAVNNHLPAFRRFAPYVLGGAGWRLDHGHDPSVTLTGHYDFAFVFGTARQSQTDAVTIRIARHGGALATIFGGGVDVAASKRGALRVEIRGVIDSRVADVLLDATPVVDKQGSASVTTTFTNPSIQFSNNPVTGATSTLSGPAIDGLQTFAGTGTAIRVNLTIGYAVRF